MLILVRAVSLKPLEDSSALCVRALQIACDEVAVAWSTVGTQRAAGWSKLAFVENGEYN
jgi:hypothetical protein